MSGLKNIYKVNLGHLIVPGNKPSFETWFKDLLTCQKDTGDSFKGFSLPKLRQKNSASKQCLLKHTEYLKVSDSVRILKRESRSEVRGSNRQKQNTTLYFENWFLKRKKMNILYYLSFLVGTIVQDNQIAWVSKGIFANKCREYNIIRKSSFLQILFP